MLKLLLLFILFGNSMLVSATATAVSAFLYFFYSYIKLLPTVGAWVWKL